VANKIDAVTVISNAPDAGRLLGFFIVEDNKLTGAITGTTELGGSTTVSISATKQ
jgi:hypothetical protein